MARAHAWMDNSDEAFRLLEIAVKQEESQAGLATHPMFTRIRDDARWLPFLQSIGEAPEQLAEIEFNPRLPDDLWRIP